MGNMLFAHLFSEIRKLSLIEPRRNLRPCRCQLEGNQILEGIADNLHAKGNIFCGDPVGHIDHRIPSQQVPHPGGEEAHP